MTSQSDVKAHDASGSECPTRTVGMIGLGAMGGAMVRRLLDRGVTVVVSDVNETALGEHAAAGALPCSSPAEVVAAADVTLLSLPNSSIVETVVLGTNGVLSAARPGKAVVDMSSSDPDSTVALGARFADTGCDFLDAPVSRGARAARDGTLSILVGGDAKALERVQPVLAHLGTDVIHVGRVGAGHAAKALNNHMSATALLAAFEGFITAAKAGVDPEVAVEAINQGSGKSHMSEIRFPLYYLPRRFDSNFSLGLMAKDCQIAVEMAARRGKPLLLGSLTSQLYRLALNMGPADADNTRMLQVMESLLGSRMDDVPEQ